jgi:TatD DNase family protein
MPQIEFKTNNYIDIHCHYDELSKEELLKLKSNNITSLTASADYESYKRLDLLRTANIENLYFAYGLHPEVILSKTKDEIFSDLAKINFDNCIAIGEIGLDYKFAVDDAKKKLQLELFERQLEIAEEKHKPVIIHSRQARKEVLDTLESWNVKAILHWFAGDVELIKKALDRGYYLSIRFGSPKLSNIAVQDIMQNIFIETDYPVFYSEFATDITNIKKSYEMFSEKYKINIETLKSEIEENFINLFKQ